ncbi:MAG: hypothetical protein HQL17_02395 [Candidatus Omnitrophica bacterium]|nr:hypothetical protein [Candidatus Omnitrophota bacterium]
MKRIGIVASRIAKDDLLVYNGLVMLFSFLLSLLIFFIAAFSILAAIALVSYVTRGYMSMDAGRGFFRFALMGLSGVVAIINFVAVIVNIKLKR